MNLDHLVKLAKSRLCPEYDQLVDAYQRLQESSERAEKNYQMLKTVAVKLYRIAEIAELYRPGELGEMPRWIIRDDMQIAQDILMDQGIINAPRMYIQMYGRESAYDKHDRRLRKVQYKLQSSQTGRDDF